MASPYNGTKHGRTLPWSWRLGIRGEPAQPGPCPDELCLTQETNSKQRSDKGSYADVKHGWVSCRAGGQRRPLEEETSKLRTKD